jgi:hypothetical protein
MLKPNYTDSTALRTPLHCTGVAKTQCTQRTAARCSQAQLPHNSVIDPTKRIKSERCFINSAHFASSNNTQKPATWVAPIILNNNNNNNNVINQEILPGYMKNNVTNFLELHNTIYAAAVAAVKMSAEGGG